MPSAAVLAPVVLPFLAAAVIAAFGIAGVSLGRAAAAAGAWSSAVALVAVWLPVRSSLELVLGQLGYGSALDLRVDGVSFAFGLMIVLPAAVLLTLQPRTWAEASISLLGVGAATAAVEAGGVVLTAIAGGTAATVAVVPLETEDPAAPRPSWALLLVGWLALSLVGVILQVGGGTAVYSAVPVATVTSGLFALLAASALLASCLLPWRMWPSRLWLRPSLRAAGISIATLYPLGFYLLVRAYELGDGRYPSQFFNVLLAVIGLGTAFAAAGRAQAAATRREFFGEVIPGLGGFALAAIGLGFANPVAAEVMRSSAASLGGGLTSVITVSSVLPAVTLFAPLLVIAIVAFGMSSTSAIKTQARPALFKLPSFAAVDQARAALRSATVPEQYRSILNVRELEAAAAGGGMVLWLVALIALAFAVTR